MMEIEAFIRRLPKAELHLHLEGTILPATLVELSARHDAQPMTLPEAEALYRFTDFTGFIEAFKAVTRRLIDPEDYELAAWRMMEHLAAQGVVHAEVYISVGVIYMWRNHDPARLRAHLCRPGARPRARRARTGPLALLDLRRRAPLHRRGGRARLPQGRRNARQLTPPSSASAWAATSAAPAPSPSAPSMPRPREAGLRLTNHAGETTGPEAIREALSIGSERIGHALSAIKDFYLLQELKERGMPAGAEPHLERPHRRLPLLCRPPAAPLLRSGPAGHAQLRRPGLLRLRPGQRVPAGPHRAGLHPRGTAPARPPTPSAPAFFPTQKRAAWLSRIDSTR